MSVAPEQPCYLTTPEYVRTFTGKYIYSFQAHGTLSLIDDEVEFAAPNWSLILPLWRVEAVALGRFPWAIQLFGLRYIEVTYAAADGTRVVWLTPTCSPSHPLWRLYANRVAPRWHDRLAEAVWEYRNRI